MLTRFFRKSWIPVMAAAFVSAVWAAGKPASLFALKNYDGKEVKLADYKGKIVVLEWFNYDCPFSRYHHESVPTMENLAKKYKSKGVQFLAINSTHYQKAEDNAAFAKKFKVTYPILDDRTGKVGRLYKAQRTPHMFVIDPNGLLVYQGAIDNAPLGKVAPDAKEKVNYVDKALAELTTGKAITIQKTKPYGCTVKYAN